MKIQGNRPQLETPATNGTEPVRGAEQPRAGRTAASSNDQVRVSTQAQFVSAAMAAASDPVAIRPEEVARAKALLQDGTLGADAGRLADALIQRTIDKT
ncbi:MAG: flagellar biosynthesis anti-sigma factor FlgM [Acidobacteria bacterium]|nr:flagellar biosynthesis anti-sigma factor FlgM [Acidobacteriota bacterium]